MNKSNSAQVLQKIAEIQRMEPGKLCIIRQGPDGPYHNLQCREHGKQVSRYVPRDQVETVATNTSNYRKFEALVEQYAACIIEQTRTERAANVKKKDQAEAILLAQGEEIQQLMSCFSAHPPTGQAVQELEGLVRTAIFKPATDLIAFMLQAAADRIDAAYQPKPGEVRKSRVSIKVQCIFGSFTTQRDYYYHPGKECGHYPADAGLGLENGFTPALNRLICLEGADETCYQKAETHLQETAGITVDARQIQRVVQRFGPAAQHWQERETAPGTERAPVLYVSADGTGVPMRKSELDGRKGKQPDGTAKTRQVYLGCVFTQHGRDEKGRPIRDYNSTTYLSFLGPITDFAPSLRREAIRRGMGNAEKTIVLIDGAEGLECMGRDYFPGCAQIVDFFHAMEHASHTLVALLGNKDHPDYKPRLRQWAKRLLKNGVKKNDR